MGTPLTRATASAVGARPGSRPEARMPPAATARPSVEPRARKIELRSSRAMASPADVNGRRPGALRVGGEAVVVEGGTVVSPARPDLTEAAGVVYATQEPPRVAGRARLLP